MAARNKKLTPAKRLALYRKRATRSGLRRVEVAVPSTDVTIIRDFAKAFREGGLAAERLRRQAETIGKSKIAKTGEEFYALLRAGVGDGVDLELPPRLYEEPREIKF